MDIKEFNVEAFWERLKQICKTRNVTQVSLCAELGIDLQQFRNKKSLGTYPTIEQLVKLSNYFGVSLNYMLTGTSTDETETQLINELEYYKSKFEQLKEIINDSSASTPSTLSNE